VNIFKFNANASSEIKSNRTGNSDSRTVYINPTHCPDLTLASNDPASKKEMTQEHSFIVHCPPYLHHGPTHIMPQTFGVLEIDERTGILISRTLKSRRTTKKKQPPRKLYKDSLFCFNSDNTNNNNWRSGSLRPQSKVPLTDPAYLSKDNRTEADYNILQPAFSRSPSVDSFLDPALSDVNSPYLSASASSSSMQLDYPEALIPQGGPTGLQPSDFFYSHALLQPVCAYYICGFSNSVRLMHLCPDFHGLPNTNTLH